MAVVVQWRRRRSREAENKIERAILAVHGTED